MRPRGLGQLFASRIGRRAFSLFVGCAVVPLAILAAVSLHAVATRLEEAADAELFGTAKSVGMSIAERVARLDDDLAVVADLCADGAVARLPEALVTRLGRRFEAIGVVRDGEFERRLFGDPGPVAELEPDERRHLSTERGLVRTDGDRVLLLQRVGPVGAPVDVFVQAVPTTEGLWGGEAERIPIGSVWVLDDRGRTVFASTDLPAPGPRVVDERRLLDWDAPDGEAWIGRARSLFLVPAWRLDWLIVHGRPREILMASSDLFRRLYLSSLGLALIVVTGIGVAQLLRTLEPIQQLRDATRKIADGDLEVRVAIDRHDEFGELGRSFDAMTERLLENIRRREQTERELVVARDEALAAARAEAAFLTNVSHEFRTPLTGIQSSAEILRDFADEPAEIRQEFVDTIVEQSRWLARLVEDVIAVSGMGSDGVARPQDEVEVVPTILAAVGALGPAVVERVQIEVPEDPPLVRGDADQLEALWTRLLDNACKFSDPADPVTVRVHAESDEIVVAVEDNGCGIAPEDHEAIFERFRQVGRDQLTDKAVGTGLGLSLAREIVRIHGGHVEVDSALGEGATFRVVLPRARVRAVVTSARTTAVGSDAG